MIPAPPGTRYVPAQPTVPPPEEPRSLIYPTVATGAADYQYSAPATLPQLLERRMAERLQRIEEKLDWLIAREAEKDE